MFKGLVFADTTFDAIMAAELVKVIYPDTSVWYTKHETDAEDFFNSGECESWDEIYCIGDVMDDFTRDYIATQDVQAKLIGMSDSRAQAEGFNWMKFCNPDGLRAGWYFKRILEIVHDFKMTERFAPIISALMGKSGKSYNVFMAMYMSMDMDSFTQWVHDRLESVSRGEAMLDDMSQMVTAHIQHYQSTLDDAMFSASETDGRVATGFVRSARTEEFRRYLDYYTSEEVVRVYSIIDNMVYTFTRCEESEAVLRLNNHFYRIDLRQGYIANAD